MKGMYMHIVDSTEANEQYIAHKAVVEVNLDLSSADRAFTLPNLT